MIFKALWLDFQENFVGLYSKSNCELFVEQLTLRNGWMVEICRIDQRIYEDFHNLKSSQQFLVFWKFSGVVL